MIVIVVVSMVFSGTLTYLFFARSGSISNTRVIYSLDQRKNDQEIIQLIDSANEYVYFAVYYFTKKDIAEALIRAKKRGVAVEGITDREGSQKSPNDDVTKMLRSAGIPLATQKHLDGIMHIKVLVTEKAYASGSYNWTQAATDANDEVLEIGTDEGIRSQYLKIIKKVLSSNMSENEKGTGKIQKLEIGEAPQHIGEYAEVRGMIEKNFTAASGTVFLDFCRSTAKCPFAAVIFASDAKKFKDVSSYKGDVTISGVIRSYKGKAEIVLNSPDQIIVNK